jgi:hypothetical protein
LEAAGGVDGRVELAGLLEDLADAEGLEQVSEIDHLLRLPDDLRVAAAVGLRWRRHRRSRSGVPPHRSEIGVVHEDLFV